MFCKNVYEIITALEMLRMTKHIAFPTRFPGMSTARCYYMSPRKKPQTVSFVFVNRDELISLSFNKINCSRSCMLALLLMFTLEGRLWYYETNSHKCRISGTEVLKWCIKLSAFTSIAAVKVKHKIIDILKGLDMF